MRGLLVKAAIMLQLLLPAGCLPLAGPAAPSGDATQAAATGTPLALGQIGALRTHIDGRENAYAPQLGEAAEAATSLLAVLAQLNLQALCMYAEQDVERFRSQQDTAELLFAQPTDIPIGQLIAEQDRGQVPTDEQGYRLLRVTQALFVLDGEMAGNVLVRDEGGRWSCWAIEHNQRLDASWVETVLPR